MWLNECKKNELDGIMLINTLFKQDRLFITRNCVDLIKELMNLKWKKIKLGQEKNIPQEPIDKDNDFVDALRYLVAGIEELKIESPEQKAFKNSMQYAIIKKAKTNNDIMRFG